ncbi:hypothetical protein ABZ702_04830 [Streptomyces cyaneofuscatus]
MATFSDRDRMISQAGTLSKGWPSSGSIIWRETLRSSLSYQ